MNRYFCMVIGVATILIGYTLIQFHDNARAQVSIGRNTAIDNALDRKTADTVVWGNTVRGIAIAVIPDKSVYRLGQAIPMTVRMKNFSPKATKVSTSGFFSEYRVALFAADGSPIAKSQSYIDQEAAFDPFHQHPVSSDAHAFLELAPGESYSDSFNVNDWYTIEKAGTYSLVVMCGSWGWNYGIAISNLMTFKVVNGKE